MLTPSSTRWGTPSISARLALPFALIVAVVLLLFVWATFGQVRRLRIETVGERLERVAHQLAAAAEAGVHARYEEMRSIAELAELRRLQDRRGPRNDTELLEQLRGRLADESDILAFTVFDGEGRRLLEVGEASGAGPWVPPTEAASAAPGAATAAGQAEVSFSVGPLRWSGEALFYEAWARLPGDRGAALLIGQRRAIALSAAGRTLIGDLVGVGGRSATINFGNGRVWTDLAEMVPAPAALAHVARLDEVQVAPLVQRVEFDVPGSGRRIGTIAAVPETPWLFVVEIDEASILTLVWGMTRRLGGLALMLVVVGGVGALALSRSITVPLERLTHATRTMAPFEQLPEHRRADEIGRLTRSFRQMREEVLASSAGLESKIRVRTAELQAAVHELESTRDELVRREKMNMLGELSAAVSHEIRNCLAVIRNATFVIASQTRGRSEQVDKQIEMLNRQVELSERIIRDLLEVGPAEPPTRRRVRLASLIDEQIARLEVPPGIEVVRDPRGERGEAYVDPVQVGQALFNLLTNALQAMGGSGTLKIDSRRQASGDLELEISDSGPGIAAHDLERIFEPLYTTKPGGTGLGLSVSRALVRANGGDIAVRNDGGAVFTLILPAAGSTPETPASRSTDPDVPRRSRPADEPPDA